MQEKLFSTESVECDPFKYIASLEEEVTMLKEKNHTLQEKLDYSRKIRIGLIRELKYGKPQLSSTHKKGYGHVSFGMQDVSVSLV